MPASQAFWWYLGDLATVTDGPYRGQRVAPLRFVGSENKILVRTVDDPERNHMFLVPDTHLELLEGAENNDGEDV